MVGIVKISDFENLKFNSYQEVKLQSYIDRYEKEYLIDLMGVALYKLFIDDLVSGLPATQIYIDIYNEILQEIDGVSLSNFGMKEMIKGFIYFHYVRDNFIKQTTTGNVVMDSENSSPATLMSANVSLSFNDAFDSFRVIQYYIKDKLTIYPTYNGHELEYILPL